MPYIPTSMRESLDRRLLAMIDDNHPLAAGDFAYVLTRVSLYYIRSSSQIMTYATLAMAVGVMFLTILEVVRRVVTPYEDIKNRQNGEVFGEIRFPKD